MAAQQCTKCYGTVLIKMVNMVSFMFSMFYDKKIMRKVRPGFSAAQ